MNEILQKLTGQPLERIEKDTDRDNFMSAHEAKEYGLVDHVLERLPPGQMPVKPRRRRLSGTRGMRSSSPSPARGTPGWTL